MLPLEFYSLSVQPRPSDGSFEASKVDVSLEKMRGLAPLPFKVGCLNLICLPPPSFLPYDTPLLLCR